MSARYPRPGDIFKIRPTPSMPCEYESCKKSAVVVRWIQFGPMRGTDDSCVCCCEDHKRIPNGDISAWCNNFPKEAWKP